MKINGKTYRDLFMSMNTGSYIAKILYDEKGVPIDYEYIDVNPAFEQIMGLSRDQIVGKTYNELVPPDPDSGWPECFKRVASTAIPDSYIFYSNIYHCYFETYAFMLSEGIFAVLVADITKRKKAELEREQFFKFFYTSTDLMVITDSNNGCIKKVNPFCIQLLGHSETEILTRLFIDFIHADDRQKSLDEMSKTIQRGFSLNFENRIVSKDGTHFWLSWHSSYSVDEGLIYATARDITERKHIEEELYKHREHLEEIVAERTIKLDQINSDLLSQINERKKIEQELIVAKEKAEESDRLKSVFLANMSHEIRTPMNAIIGFSDLLSDPDLSDDRRAHFTTLIQQRSYDLLRILEDILDISKIEVGQMKFVETNIVLSDLLSDLYEYYQQKLKKINGKSGIILKYTLANNLKKTVIRTDNQRLKQILSNLLDNALKFTHKGSIEFGCKAQAGSTLVFFVKDTGIGIPAEKHELIFDRFRQADELTIARQYGGAGLGLSIVKGILNLMKGKIWLESAIREGTTFFFTIPVAQTGIVHKSTFELSHDKKLTWKNKTVLIVEDDEINAIYLRELLSDTGLHLLIADTGEKTLKIIENNSDINLILMDIRLPDTNGLILTKMIRKTYPKIKIIAQTAYASPVDIEECIKAGCHDYISKPFDKEKLFSIIRKFLDKNS